MADNICALYCKDANDTRFDKLSDAVKDGTPCRFGTNDLCIMGICRVCIITFWIASNT